MQVARFSWQLGDALDIGDQTKSYLLFQRLYAILNHMQPWNHLDMVKQFARQMAVKTQVAQYQPLLMEGSFRDYTSEA